MCRLVMPSHCCSLRSFVFSSFLPFVRYKYKIDRFYFIRVNFSRFITNTRCIDDFDNVKNNDGYF